MSRFPNELALRLLGARRIESLPIYAIDFSAWDRAMAAVRKTSRQQRKSIAVVARLVPEKNLATALRALSSDPALRDGIRVTVVGDGPARAELEALARQGSLACDFLGARPRSEVGAVVGSADALWLPSTREPWGIVVCEALGLGVPVIATPAVGSAVSLAGLSRGVVLSASPSQTDLAGALRVFLQSSRELSTAAIASAPLVRQLYAMPNVVSKLVALLRELTGGAS